jgi:hypothetical protein
MEQKVFLCVYMDAVGDDYLGNYHGSEVYKARCLVEILVYKQLGTYVCASPMRVLSVFIGVIGNISHFSANE